MAMAMPGWCSHTFEGVLRRHYGSSREQHSRLHGRVWWHQRTARGEERNAGFHVSCKLWVLAGHVRLQRHGEFIVCFASAAFPDAYNACTGPSGWVPAPRASPNRGLCRHRRPAVPAALVGRALTPAFCSHVPVRGSAGGRGELRCSRVPLQWHNLRDRLGPIRAAPQRCIGAAGGWVSTREAAACSRTTQTRRSVCLRVWWRLGDRAG